MHILITNDDGINAPGLLALVQEMRKLGEITILAPDRNWSASGHVKTMHRPLRVKEVCIEDGTLALASDGAPSDCVSLAALGLVEPQIDIVVSGINLNANLGYDVTYSGTVTAVMEATIWGLPGIAFSLDAPDNHGEQLDFVPAARIANQVVRNVIRDGLPEQVLLNVNVPNLPYEEIKGLRFTRQGLRIYHDQLDRRVDPRGRPYYWIGGDAPTGVPEDQTDIGTLAEGYVSITPLHLDLTAYHAFDPLESWNLEIEP